MSDWVHTSSQIEARPSAERFFALFKPMMESNGLGCKGVNPVANLKVLQKPIEPHSKRSPGIASFCVFRPCCCKEKAEKQRFGSQEEDDGASLRRIALSDEEAFAVLVILDVKLCIIYLYSNFKMRCQLSSNSIRRVILSNALRANTTSGKVERDTRA